MEREGITKCVHRQALCITNILFFKMYAIRQYLYKDKACVIGIEPNEKQNMTTSCQSVVVLNKLAL
jgi:hypothetical protein